MLPSQVWETSFQLEAQSNPNPSIYLQHYCLYIILGTWFIIPFIIRNVGCSYLYLLLDHEQFICSSCDPNRHTVPNVLAQIFHVVIRKAPENWHPVVPSSIYLHHHTTNWKETRKVKIRGFVFLMKAFFMSFTKGFMYLNLFTLCLWGNITECDG